MQLRLDTLAVHNLGDFTISETREFEGGDAPQRAKVTLRVAVDVDADTYADNRGLLEQLHLKLKQQQATLRWTNDDTGQDYLNQSVTLTATDLPEDPSAWGQYAQQLTFTVYYYLHDLTTQNMPLEFAPSSGPLLSLSHVAEWSEATSVERVSPLRGHRKSVERKLTVSGFILGDVKQPLATRRAALLVKKAELERLNQTEGTLRFGTSPNYVINRLVRVDEFTCTVNQLIARMEWSFTAHYKVFPDEAGYSLLDYTVDERDGQTGEQLLTLAGKIGAATEALARAQLVTLTTALLAQYGYAAAQPMPEQTTAQRVTADTDGDTFTELTFNREYRRWRSDNQQATFRKTGSQDAAVSLGEVRDWSLDYNASRVSDHRSQRNHATGRVEAAGTFKGDPTKTPALRRVELLAVQQLMQDEVNSADGVLVYGAAFSKTVRVDSFKAVINQAITGIDWSFSASWSRFPNEAGYATAEFTVSVRDNVEDGDENLAFNGRILAQSRAAAITKLDALRTSVLSLYVYTPAQRLGGDKSAQHFFGNDDKTAGLAAVEQTDGTTFLELTFNEAYRKRISGLVSFTVKTTVRDDVSTGLSNVTYSGSITASGATADAAYGVAVIRAATLGANKESVIGNLAYLRSSQISWDIRQTQEGVNTPEFVRLEFSYEYVAKLAVGRAYFEVTSSVNTDSFGADSESVSGFVVAVDAAAADVIYQAQIKAAYAGRLIRGERLSSSRTGAQRGASFVVHPLRLEFSFDVHSPKSTVALKYAFSVGLDYIALEKTTRVGGSVFAVDRLSADTALSLLETLAGGSLLRSERNEDREYNAADAPPAGQEAGRFVKLDFEDTYLDRILGDTALIEMRLSESMTYSGNRLAVQPTLKNSDGSGGYSVVQCVSVQEGGRSLRGSATSAVRATAETWCKQQRALLTGTYLQPEQWETDYEFIPRIAGVSTGVGQNVKLWRVGFNFSEVLPNNPAPV